MTDEAMSPLRRRMIEDMTIRKLAPKTQQGYIRTIKDFAAFLGRSPDTASFEDVRRFQLHLAASGAHIPILNHTVAALRFFFRVLIGVGSRRRSASQAIDLPSDGGVNFGRLFTPASTGGGVRPSRPLSALTSAGWCR